jgi:hypothetical protein
MKQEMYLCQLTTDANIFRGSSKRQNLSRTLSEEENLPMETTFLSHDLMCTQEAMEGEWSTS